MRVLNQAYGLPAGTLHRISSVQLAGSTVIEIDEYLLAAGVWSPGSTRITSVTLAGSQPERKSAGPKPLPVRAEQPYWGASVWALAGPFGLRLEVAASERHV